MRRKTESMTRELGTAAPRSIQYGHIPSICAPGMSCQHGAGVRNKSALKGARAPSDQKNNLSLRHYHFFAGNANYKECCDCMEEKECCGCM